MKLEKKHWIMIAIAIVVLIALWHFFLRKKTTTSSYAGVYGFFGNESGYDMAELDKNLPMIGTESSWVGNAQYNDCHRNCMKTDSVANCDKKCGRGTKGASAFKVQMNTKHSNYIDPGPAGLGSATKPGPYKGR